MELCNKIGSSAVVKPSARIVTPHTSRPAQLEQVEPHLPLGDQRVPQPGAVALRRERRTRLHGEVLLAPLTVWPSEGQVELLLHPIVTQPHRHLRPTPSSAAAVARLAGVDLTRCGSAPGLARHQTESRYFLSAATGASYGTITTPPNSVGVVRRRECRPCTAVLESTNAVAPPSAHLPSGESPVDQPHVHLRSRTPPAGQLFAHER